MYDDDRVWHDCNHQMVGAAGDPGDRLGRGRGAWGGGEGGEWVDEWGVFFDRNGVECNRGAATCDSTGDAGGRRVGGGAWDRGGNFVCGIYEITRTIGPGAARVGGGGAGGVGLLGGWRRVRRRDR